MPPTPNYSQLAAAAAKKKAPLTQAEVKKVTTPPPAAAKIVPASPIITGGTGSQLAARASQQGPLTAGQAQATIRASQPPPPPTITGYTGITSTQGSILAGQAASKGGPLSNADIQRFLNPPDKSVLEDMRLPAGRDKSPIEDFRAGEREPTQDRPASADTSNAYPSPYGDTGLTNELGGGPQGQPWSGRAGDPADAGGWSIWGSEQREETLADRWKAIADTYGKQDKKPPIERGMGAGVDARGNPPVPRTGEQLAVTDAARWTGLAISGQLGTARWEPAWPNLITERVAEELNYRGMGYESAAEWLADVGYYYDERDGVWRRADVGAPQMTTAEGEYAGPVGETGYDYSWGDYGWGDYGYGRGGGYDGGGYGYNSGLINWRIGL